MLAFKVDKFVGYRNFSKYFLHSSDHCWRIMKTKASNQLSTFGFYFNTQQFIWWLTCSPGYIAEGLWWYRSTCLPLRQLSRHKVDDYRQDLLLYSLDMIQNFLLHSIQGSHTTVTPKWRLLWMLIQEAWANSHKTLSSYFHNQNHVSKKGILQKNFVPMRILNKNKYKLSLTQLHIWYDCYYIIFIGLKYRIM